MKFLSRLLPFTLFAPMFALAALSSTDAANFNSAGNFLTNFVSFINNTAVPAVFALGFLVFVWGMFNTFILGGADEAKQEKGKQLMMYSIAGFVLMISLWGIVNIVASGFGLQDEGGAVKDLLPKANVL